MQGPELEKSRALGPPRAKPPGPIGDGGPLGSTPVMQATDWVLPQAVPQYTMVCEGDPTD